MPWQPLILGLEFQVRVGDLQASDFLERRCPQCALVTGVATCAQRPDSFICGALPRARLVDLVPNMFCRRCGHHGAQRWAIFRASLGAGGAVTNGAPGLAAHS